MAAIPNEKGKPIQDSWTSFLLLMWYYNIASTLLTALFLVWVAQNSEQTRL